VPLVKIYLVISTGEVPSVAHPRFIYFSYCLVTAQRSAAVQHGLPQDPAIYVTNDNLFRPPARVPTSRSFLFPLWAIFAETWSRVSVTSTSVRGPFNVEPPPIIYFTPIEAHIRYVKPTLLAIYDMACTTWKNALLAVCKKEKSGSLYHGTQQHKCLCGANKTKEKNHNSERDGKKEINEEGMKREWQKEGNKETKKEWGHGGQKYTNK
jgi:hypothetical protein